MKKLMFLFLCCFVTSAFSAEVSTTTNICVKISGSEYAGGGDYGYLWETELGGIGVGVCSTSDSSFTPGLGSYCYCKMLYPFFGVQWMYTEALNDSSNCFRSCPSVCARYYQNNTNNFRAQLLFYL